RRPAIEISSSNPSQWRPRVLKVTCSRSAAEACSSLGNQASGTPKVLPSDSSTQKLSLSKWTLVGLAKEVIPSAFYFTAVVADDFNQFPQRLRVEAVIVGQSYIRKKPKLGVDAVL